MVAYTSRIIMQAIPARVIGTLARPGSAMVPAGGSGAGGGGSGRSGCSLALLDVDGVSGVSGMNVPDSDCSLCSIEGPLVGI